MNLKKFVLEGNPVCRKEAVIVGDHFRITMLTTALIRFEYSEDEIGRASCRERV